MENKFKIIPPEEISDNPFKLIGKEWMLITAGDENNFNMMTASWGTFGILWNKPIAIVFVRHHRYTFEFVEKHECFTLSYFDSSFREVLHLCGTTSGREVNKIEETGLKAFSPDDSCVAFEQAKMVLVCKKIYFNDLVSDNFLDKDVLSLYPNKDYHRAYIGEIKQCLVKE